MTRSLVIGASGGIGAAVAAALQMRGAVTKVSRGDGLSLTDESSVVATIGAIEGSFDLIFVATGALGQPEKTLKALTLAEMASQFAVNAAGPALVLKHVLPLLPRDRHAVFAVLSARVGSIGDNALGGWYSYRASKAALNQLMHTAAIEVARTHPQAIIATLHPGTVATRFTDGYGREKVSPDQAAANLLAVIDGLSPAQSGGFFDYAGRAIPW
jgi:NAD(P)-dependent dehydrogenase (short-subunit alcohol dehydrogenase family)